MSPSPAPVTTLAEAQAHAAHAPRGVLSCFRLADADDVVALQRLAGLSSGVPPRGRVLVAEVNGQLWAAIGLEDWLVVSDPRRPTQDLALQLATRARRLVLDERGELRRRTRSWRASER